MTRGGLSRQPDTCPRPNALAWRTCGLPGLPCAVHRRCGHEEGRVEGGHRIRIPGLARGACPTPRCPTARREKSVSSARVLLVYEPAYSRHMPAGVCALVHGRRVLNGCSMHGAQATRHIEMMRACATSLSALHAMVRKQWRATTAPPLLPSLRLPHPQISACATAAT